ncbi:hypothetical protein KFU94_60520 [Chloroflexi bacterium TSY]|nr:hypothetical protein [Chloroflexi bacterium TSY]
MKTRQVTLPNRPVVGPTDDGVAVIPVIIPELKDIVLFAHELHAKGESWEGTAFGWQVSYEPEGIMYATFDIGVNGLFFVSVNWEFGSDRPPYVYCEDDYGYDSLPDDLVVSDLKKAIAEVPST